MLVQLEDAEAEGGRYQRRGEDVREDGRRFPGDEVERIERGTQDGNKPYRHLDRRDNSNHDGCVSWAFHL